MSGVAERLDATAGAAPGGGTVAEEAGAAGGPLADGLKGLISVLSSLQGDNLSFTQFRLKRSAIHNKMQCSPSRFEDPWI